MRSAWQTFVVTVAVLLMPLLLFAGILVADRNTREVGFPDRAPVFALERQEDGGVNVTVLDWRFRLNPIVTRVWDDGVMLIKTATPHAAKAGAAITEKIIDRFLGVADRAG